ncbi:MAG: rod shape-determining protein MreD [Arenicellales bacterium WSBS_2016_MAG_OTU3]
MTAASLRFHENTSGRWVIPFTFVVALGLTAIPLPDWMLRFRPDWVALTLIYWCLAAPARVGVGYGWVAGLMLDAIQLGLLGKNALAKTVVAYLISQKYLRMRVFPMLQQVLIVFLVLSIDLAVVTWIQSISQKAQADFVYWTQTLASMMAWPLVFFILRAVKRRAGVK